MPGLGSGASDGDWVAYVGWVTAVAAVVAVVSPLAEEVVRMLKRLNPEPHPHSRGVVLAAAAMVVSVFAAQHFGLIQGFAIWVEGQMSRLSQATQAWIGGLLIGVLILWTMQHNVRQKWAAPGPVWRWVRLLPVLNGLTVFSLIVVTLAGPRWLAPADASSAIVWAAMAVAVTGLLWGLQGAFAGARRTWREKHVVDAAGGVDSGGFCPRMTAVGIAAWLALFVSMTVVKVEAAGGWPYLTLSLSLLALTGALLPQAILLLLWRRRLRHRFEQVSVLDLDTVMARLESEPVQL